MRFYGEFMVLDLAIENVPCEPIASSQGPGSDLVQWDSHLYTARGGGSSSMPPLSAADEGDAGPALQVAGVRAVVDEHEAQA